MNRPGKTLADIEKYEAAVNRVFLKVMEEVKAL